MGQFIVKLREHYLVWSTIVDAPITNGMNEKQLTRWMRSRYGSEGIKELPERLARVEAKGTSAMNEESAESTIWLNRAGPDESTLTIVGIYHHYCLGEPIKDEWIVPGRVIGGDEDDDGLTYDAVLAGWDNEPAASNWTFEDTLRAVQRVSDENAAREAAGEGSE